MVKPGETAIVHLLTRKENGPIRSAGLPRTKDFGKEVQWVVACCPDAPLPQFASGEHTSINCPLCLKTPEYEETKATQQSGGNPADAAAMKAMQAMKEAGGGGCDGC